MEKKSTAKKTTKTTTKKVVEAPTRIKRKVTGLVVSDKSAKTIVVKVDKKFMHPKYNKFVTRSKKFHAHDENQKAKVGNTVIIIESKPLSKLKRWQLLEILK